jgi:hypothetical protein
MTKLPVPRVVVPVLCITQTRSAELLLRGRPLRRALGRRRRSIFCVEPLGVLLVWNASSR